MLPFSWMKNRKLSMAIATEKIFTFMSPFLLASLVGLGSWVNRIEQRQYEQISTMASKAELVSASVQLNKTLNLFINAYEKQRAEDRDTFGAAISRIEASQLETSKKMDALTQSVLAVGVTTQVNSKILEAQSKQGS